MVVVALLSVDLVESVDLVSVDLVVNCISLGWCATKPYFKLLLMGLLMPFASFFKESITKRSSSPITKKLELAEYFKLLKRKENR